MAELDTSGPGPLRDRIRDALRSRIGAGELRPGDRLFEQELAAEYGVSRVPVREAIRMLQSEGLVDVLPRRRGVFVRSLDRRQVEELFDVREALECLAARLAAQRPGTEGVDRLGAFAGKARHAHQQSDVDSMADANAQFHEELVALSANELLGTLLEPLHGRLQWLFRLNLEPERVCDEHDELHEAIAAGDAERAVAVAQRHVRASKRMVLDRMLF